MQLLYTFTSIAFFLFIIQWIFIWVAIWQSNEYRLIYLFKNFQKTPKRTIIKKAFIFVIFFLTLPFYGIVIFYDQFTSWYQFSIAILFIICGILFIKNILRSNYVKPKFGVKALIISLLTTFLVAFLFENPLTDIYLWFIILSFFLPFFIGLFVILLAFPSEICEDIIFQRNLKNLEKKDHTKSIVVIGQYNEQVVAYIQAIREIDFFPFALKSLQEDKQEKILRSLKPSFFIITNMDGQKSEQEFSNQYKSLFRSLPRNVTILSYPHDKILMASKKFHKKVLFYGLQKSFKGQKLVAFVHTKKTKTSRSYTIQVGRETMLVKNKQIQNKILIILPVLYIAKKLGVRFKKDFIKPQLSNLHNGKI